MSATSPLSLEDVKVFDPDTYANGDPSTFGLPLEQYKYLREEHPCYLQRFDDPLLVEQTWVVSRYEDIVEVDRNAEVWSAAGGGVNIWKVVPLQPAHIAEEIGFGKPAMLVMDGDDHRRNRGTVSRAFTPKRWPRSRGASGPTPSTSSTTRSRRTGRSTSSRWSPTRCRRRRSATCSGSRQQDRPKFFGWVDQFASPYDSA